jgi:hypothetical protein
MENDTTEYCGCENCDAEGCSECRKVQSHALLIGGLTITYDVYQSDTVIVRWDTESQRMSKNGAREHYRTVLNTGAQKVL